MVKKKFRYKLERVLEQKKRIEEEFLKKFADSQQKVQAEIQRKKDYLLSLETSLLRREQMTEVSSVWIQDLVTENQFITGIKKNLEKQELVIFKARKQLEKSMKDYLQARRQTKIFEKLKEKKKEEFKIESKKKEEKDADDLMVMRNAMNSFSDRDLEEEVAS